MEDNRDAGTEAQGQLAGRISSGVRSYDTY